MNNPTFSVIIPTLNEEKFLPHLLDSLVLQTNKDFEVIVVDGLSKDKTVEVAHRFDATLPSLQILTGDKRGVSRQRNIGAKNARGEWLVFIDADSVLYPHTLDRIAAYIKTHKPTIFTSWFSPDQDTQSDGLSTLFANMYIEGSILVHRPVSPGTMTIIHKSIFDSIRGYDETVTFAEDYDLTTRVAKAGYPLAILRETLYIYSFRRMRREGKLKFLQTYIKGAFLAIINNNGIRNMPGYIMGGHLYNQQKTVKKSLLRTYEAKLRKLIREFFE